MATATFNTPIYSSRNGGNDKIYNLDEVITKNFRGPYVYNLNDRPPMGVSIKDGNILNIPPNVEFELVIFVNETEAVTNVTLDPSSFNDVKETFLKNKNLEQNLSNTKNEWSKIINRNANNKVDNDIKPN
jgi:hypothetical protein